MIFLKGLFLDYFSITLKIKKVSLKNIINVSNCANCDTKDVNVPKFWWIKLRLGDIYEWNLERTGVNIANFILYHIFKK